VSSSVSRSLTMSQPGRWSLSWWRCTGRSKAAGSPLDPSWWLAAASAGAVAKRLGNLFRVVLGHERD